LDNGSKCLSFFELFLSDGQENQAYPPHGHSQSDRSLADKQKIEIEFALKEKGSIV
jgi:hypothetical protein